MAGYFDHNATTPLDPRVRDEMLPWLGERWGNASSVHAFGREAGAAVEEARERVAAALAVRPQEVVFTASGTEANNAVLSACGRLCGFAGHVVVSAFEHPSVLRAAEDLERAGMKVTRVAPDREGQVAAEAMVAALREDTRLICLMLANNEVGTLQPVREVAAACRDRRIPILCDAVQAVGKIPVDVGRLGVDYLTLGAHKFHGPLGAAALWIRDGAPFLPFLVGGSQEQRRRAATVNVPAVVGLGAAAALVRSELPARAARLAALRDRFEAGLREGAAAIPGAVVHGASRSRLPNTSHIAVPGVAAQALMIRLDLDGYAVSTGSACGSGVVDASPAMRAMGIPEEEALASLRVSFGTTNTEAEVDGLLATLAAATAALRAPAARSRGAEAGR